MLYRFTTVVSDNILMTLILKFNNVPNYSAISAQCALSAIN